MLNEGSRACLPGAQVTRAFNARQARLNLLESIRLYLE